LELFADQLPSTQPHELQFDCLISSLSGAGVAVSGAQSIVLGAGLGVVGGIAGAFAGYEIRTRLVKALKVPDLVIALLEDAVTIGAGASLSCRGFKQPRLGQGAF